MNFLKWILWVTVISVVLFIGTMILDFLVESFPDFAAVIILIATLFFLWLFFKPDVNDAF